MAACIVTWAIPATAQTPSFDCAKATQPIEHLVCGHAGLAYIDSQLNTAFKEALSAAEDKGRLLAEQRRWLRTRVEKCQVKVFPQDKHAKEVAENCIATSYNERLAEFGKMGPRTLSEAERAFARRPTLSSRADLVMFMHVFSPASEQRDKAIRDHLAALLKDIGANEGDVDPQSTGLDHRIFDALDLIVARDNLKIPCPVILRDRRYSGLLFARMGIIGMRAYDACDSGDLAGYPHGPMKAYADAVLTTLYDWQSTTGTNGPRYLE